MEEVNIYINNLNDASLSIVREIRNWKSRKVRILISSTDLKNAEKRVQNIIGEWLEKTVEIVDPGKQIDWSLGYYEWDLSSSTAKCLVSDGLKMLIQRCRTWHCQFVILGDSPKCKHQMFCFVDAPHKPDLPDQWHKCHWLTTFDEIEGLCRQNGIVVFDPVNNRARFEPTGHIQQGEKVYKDLKKAHLIYLDHFHKNHYEAFDTTGRHHLGEISLNGILDPNKADPNKHLTL